MNIAQIAAIIQLLIAFNVPGPVVAHVEQLLERAPMTQSAGTAELAPQAPEVISNPIRIDTSVLTTRLTRFFPKGVHGTVDLWADQLVMQGGQDIAAGSDITYLLNGSALGSPSGILGDYSFPLDTRQYANGTTTLTIAADDGAGNTASQALTFDIEN